MSVLEELLPRFTRMVKEWPQGGLFQRRNIPPGFVVRPHGLHRRKGAGRKDKGSGGDDCAGLIWAYVEALAALALYRRNVIALLEKTSPRPS
jgi:hypothetical protein